MSGPSPGLVIEAARDGEQAAAVEEMAWEFIGWLNERYPERREAIARYLREQKFAEQIGDLLTHYTPPRGECLLARLDGAAVGILMLKDVGGGTCEMNRMFVRPAARGSGAGRALVTGLIERAVGMGFRRMVLGALTRHHEALALYTGMGFRPSAPDGLAGDANGVIHMALDLRTR